MPGGVGVLVARFLGFVMYLYVMREDGFYPRARRVCRIEPSPCMLVSPQWPLI